MLFLMLTNNLRLVCEGNLAIFKLNMKIELDGKNCSMQLIFLIFYDLIGY